MVNRAEKMMCGAGGLGIVRGGALSFDGVVRSSDLHAHAVQGNGGATKRNTLMKKLMIATAIAAAAIASNAEITSSNVVGYQNKAPDNSGFVFQTATFKSVSKDDAAMTLGDIKASADFTFSAICFLNDGAGNVRIDNPLYDGVDPDQPARVNENYCYFADPSWTETGIAGWYLENDINGKICFNEKVVPFGQGFMVYVDGNETAETINYAGEVKSKPTAITFVNGGFNFSGNCSPTEIKLGDITATENFTFSAICFLNDGAGNVRIDNPLYDGVDPDQPARVNENYCYFADPSWTETGIAGWYLENDINGKICYNEKVLKAGQGFMVYIDGNETGESISIPSAIPAVK